MMADVMTRMQKMRAKMMIQHPFWATMLVRMPMIETRDIPTAATDMESIFINPDFIESLESDDLVSFVLAHELAHRMLEHGIRLGARDPRLWNIAGDFAINLMLKNSGFTVWDQALLDEQYADMSADQIYAKLKQQVEKQKKAGKGQPGQGQPGDGFGDAGGMVGDLLPPKAMTPAEEAKLTRQIQQSVAQAAHVARMAGKIPGGLERFIQEVLDPKVPWQVLLRDYMTRFTKDDETWNRRNRRCDEFFLPARYSEKMGEYIAIGDTSGSIGNDELAKYVAEWAQVAEDVKPERIRIVWADTRVAGEQTFEEGEPIIAKPKGGGGTDMTVPLKHVEQYNPDVVVLFTDGYTPWPATEPPYPLIVCCTTNADVPVGTVVRI
jgi:predicted metal-dependent peptidase